MKIVAWNCNMAFRKKFMYIEHFDADIYVISECEDPKESDDLFYKKFACNHIWYGTNKHKGLGIFCKPELKFNLTSWFNENNKYIIPLTVNNEFTLIACWIFNHHQVENQLWQLIQMNKQHLNNTLIVGDLNNNKIWDNPNHAWNFSNIVGDLEELDITSLYHLHFNEHQGNESKPTLYMQRNKTKPYHVDHAFASKTLIQNKLSYHVGDYEEWKNHSDHMPLIIEF